MDHGGIALQSGDSFNLSFDFVERLRSQQSLKRERTEDPESDSSCDESAFPEFPEPASSEEEESSEGDVDEFSYSDLDEYPVVRDDDLKETSSQRELITNRCDELLLRLTHTSEEREELRRILLPDVLERFKCYKDGEFGRNDPNMAETNGWRPYHCAYEAITCLAQRIDHTYVYTCTAL